MAKEELFSLDDKLGVSIKRVTFSEPKEELSIPWRSGYLITIIYVSGEGLFKSGSKGSRLALKYHCKSASGEDEKSVEVSNFNDGEFVFLVVVSVVR